MRRHLRLSNDRFLARSAPGRWAAARAVVHRVVAERGVRRVVVFGGDLAEFATDLHAFPRILDVCDSVALTRRRELAHAGGLRVRNLLGAVDLARARRSEAGLPGRFDVVTTVSEVDTAEIVALSGARANVRTVPNGVDERYLAPMPAAGSERGVVFWGNLGFGPNAEAMRYFVQQVWLPRLRPAGVRLRVIGSGAPAWLSELAWREPLLEVCGFVTDLRSAVGGYPIMVNPMLTGSGLKNKVLEAFGLGAVVVSTAMGVEALAAVRDGEHLVIVPPTGDFGAAVLDLLDDPDRRRRLRAAANDLLRRHYRWSEVATAWTGLWASAGQGPSGPPRTLSGSEHRGDG